MTNGPLITVVIPAYNAEDYLDQTLLSVLGQTHRALEVIVVNDGSTDSTEWIAQSAAAQDSRLRVVNMKNGGVARARNRGIDEASGEFIAFLDADDLWHPLKLEEQIKALQTGEGRNAAAAYTQMRIVDWEGRVVRNGSGIGYSGSVFVRHLFSRPVGNGSSLFVRREIASEVGGFDPKWLACGIGGCEDLDFELKIAARYPIVGIRRYLIGYRSHTNNMSMSAFSLARSVIATVEQHLAAHPELPRWAVRKVRASTIEYALKNIATAGQWKPYASEFLRLQRIDPVRGMQYAARHSVRKLLPFLHLPVRPAAQAGLRPFFLDLSPDQDADPSGRPRLRDRRVLALLAALDRERAASLSSLP